MDWTELIEYAERYNAVIESERKKVSSREYINWVYEYVSANKLADDESALYIYHGVDAEFGKSLGYFMSYVEDLARRQGLFVAYDDESYFDTKYVFIKIKDKYFKISTTWGQGSLTEVELLDTEPGYRCVIIDC